MYIQGARKDNEKTFFQYGVDDVLDLLKFNIEGMKEEIDQHFASTPEVPFMRKGRRSNYQDGHYYRIDIDTDGRIMGFHPYNYTGNQDVPVTVGE
jgi:hypothetical protein